LALYLERDILIIRYFYSNTEVYIDKCGTEIHVYKKVDNFNSHSEKNINKIAKYSGCSETRA